MKTYTCEDCKHPIRAGDYAFRLDIVYGQMVSDVTLASEAYEGTLVYHSGCWILCAKPRLANKEHE